jgi:hypothetical protein
MSRPASVPCGLSSCASPDGSSGHARTANPVLLACSIRVSKLTVHTRAPAAAS